jgi:hypothetical protein
MVQYYKVGRLAAGYASSQEFSEYSRRSRRFRRESRRNADGPRPGRYFTLNSTGRQNRAAQASNRPGRVQRICPRPPRLHLATWETDCRRMPARSAEPERSTRCVRSSAGCSRSATGACALSRATPAGTRRARSAWVATGERCPRPWVIRRTAARPPPISAWATRARIDPAWAAWANAHKSLRRKDCLEGLSRGGYRSFQKFWKLCSRVFAVPEATRQSDDSPRLERLAVDFRFSDLRQSISLSVVARSFAKIGPLRRTPEPCRSAR